MGRGGSVRSTARGSVLGMTDELVIDLHAHSYASDGTDSPAELVHNAHRAGIDVVAITDHDTTAGWDEAAEAAGVEGVTLVRGAEISTVHEGIKTHLLAYLFDPEDPALIAEFGRVRESRVHRGRRMAERIGQDFPITWEDVLAQAETGATVGRPHIADALVAAGVVRNRDEAFATILAPERGYYGHYYVIPTEVAVRAVARAGGVSVIAHPGASQRGRVLSFDQVNALREAGLAGLEVNHRDHTDAQREELARWAGELGLIATGSSDYHGAGKPNRLGEHTTTPAALRRIVEAATGVGLAGEPLDLG